MKHVKTLFRKLCMMLLPIFGVSAASCIFAPAYGTPHADFRISGKVIDFGTKQPIENIQITSEEDWESLRPVYSQKDGTFEISYRATSFGSPTTLHFEDIDGSENGEYEKTERQITAKRTKKGDGWYNGAFEATDVVIQLERKLQ